MSSDLRVVFAGTPEIARLVLERVLSAGLKVSLVLTKPDRPKGRGQKLAQSQVKELAQAHDIEVLQPISFKQDSQTLDRIQQLQPDLMLVVAYGLILPQTLLDIPRLGCINLHVSLLPRHRGAAPIQRAILDGDIATGVTIMHMDSGLDTGDVLLQRALEIQPTDTSGSLHDKLALLGAELVIEYLNNHQHLAKVAQGEAGVTYAHKISKAEAEINWHENAEIIERKIRGYNPFPGCFTYLDQQLVKIWQSSVGSVFTQDRPGTIISTAKDQMSGSCGDGSVLIISQLQTAGKTRQSAKDYIHGRANLNGKQFSSLGQGSGNE